MSNQNVDLCFARKEVSSTKGINCDDLIILFEENIWH